MLKHNIGIKFLFLRLMRRHIQFVFSVGCLLCKQMQWVYRVNGICGAIFIYGFLGVCSSSITTSLWGCWSYLQSIAMCCVWYIFNVCWGCNRWLYGGSVLYHQSCYSGVCCDWQPLVFSQHGWVENFSMGIVLDALHAVLSMCLLYIRWHVHTP